MKKYLLKFLLALSLFCGLQNCGQKKESMTEPAPVEAQPRLIDRAGWLIGRWENASGKETMIEQWEKVNDSVFKGFSVVIANKDTVFNESIVLEQRKGELFYIVSVPNQNNEKPVAFKLGLSREDELLFQNSTHDYPGRIMYKNPKPDSLVATIATFAGEKQQTFRMRKVD